MADSTEERIESWFQRLRRELKERRVTRVATLYVILFWPVIQIADILSPALDLPDAAMRLLLIAFAGGLPIVLALAWVYDLNRSGIVRSSKLPEGKPQQAGNALLGRSVERGIIGVLLFVIVVLGYIQYTSEMPRDQPAATAAVPRGVRAVAVLPFATFSHNADDQFFADGLTEELLNVLSKLKNLRVTARTSAFAYKGVSKNVQEIGRELEVDTILEGSVRRNDIDDTIRVTAQLISVETGTHIWSQTFDREFRDVFKIQDEIAAAVVEQLQVTLLANERAKLHTRDSANAEALVVSSMGRAELAKRTQQSLSDARRFFQRAIAADPEYADAHAGLATAQALLVEYTDQAPEGLAIAEGAANRGIEIDDQSPEAWAALGLVHMIRKEREPATDALEKALEFNPSHAMAHMWLGNMQSDPVKRMAYYKRAFELDPRSPAAGYNYARGLLQSGRDGEAMVVFASIVEADPYYSPAYTLVADINESRGRLAEAIQHLRYAYELDERFDVAIRLASLYIDIGQSDEAESWIAAAKAKAPQSMRLGLRWLEISALTAQGLEDRARDMIAPMVDVDEPDYDKYVNAAIAAYFLEQPEQTIKAWERARGLKGAQPATPLLPLAELDWAGIHRLDASIAAAYAYAQTGKSDLAKSLLVPLEKWLDEQLSAQPHVTPDLWFMKVQVVAIRGEENLALLHLQRAIDEGWRQHWRPFVEPCLQQLAELSAFRSMMAGLATRMELMAEQLEFDGSFYVGVQSI